MYFMYMEKSIFRYDSLRIKFLEEQQFLLSKLNKK